VTAALRFLVATVVIAALVYLAWPWIKNALYVAELLAEELPMSLPMPVQGVSIRTVRDTFGAPRPGDRKHQGTDIFAPRGTPVVSTTRGIVSRLGQNSLGGTVVWVLGPGGDRHYYAHLDRIAAIRTGQRVEAGDILGAVGDTGNARDTPPHLHYGIYRIGGAINPFPLLAVTSLPSAPPKAAARKSPASAGAL
jgi:peptidoglycan LD-endopeptidase LytH